MPRLVRKARVTDEIGFLGVSPPSPYILGRVSGGPSRITGRTFLTLNLSCTAGLHLPYESWTSTSVPLSGPRQVQASSSWAFCLQGHQVGLPIGVVGSPPRQDPSDSTKFVVVRAGLSDK